MYRVSYGSPGTLECIVDSRPQHSDVTWYRVNNGVRTPVTINNNYDGATVSRPSLTIRNVDFADAGSYVCSAENPAGRGYSDETSVKLLGGTSIQINK